MAPITRTYWFALYIFRFYDYLLTSIYPVCVFDKYLAHYCDIAHTWDIPLFLLSQLRLQSCCCCCRPHSTNVLPAESSTRNHVAASSLSPQVARKGSTLSGFVQRSRLEREVGRDLHSNKWEEVWSCIRQSGQSGEGCRGSPMEKIYETRSGDLFVRRLQSSSSPSISSLLGLVLGRIGSVNKMYGSGFIDRLIQTMQPQ